ncbi:hypothetical protein D3C76_858170 [compost metagenome]
MHAFFQADQGRMEAALVGLCIEQIRMDLVLVMRDFGKFYRQTFELKVQRLQLCLQVVDPFAGPGKFAFDFFTLVFQHLGVAFHFAQFQIE